MTNRELFRRFYRLTRISDRIDALQLGWMRHLLTKEAVAEGMSHFQANKCRVAALCAFLASIQPVREPSRNSVAIQLSVHTFGRVTRGRA